MEFKRKKLITVPILKLVEDKTIYVRITGPMFLGKEEKPKADGEKPKERAMLLPCQNLQENNAECQVIASSVIKGNLIEHYPDGSYAGKCFAFTKRGRNPGKQYNMVDIEEIEDPDAKPAEEPPENRKSAHRAPARA